MHALRLFWAANFEEAWIRRRVRVNRRTAETVDEMSQSDFISRFRLNKQTFSSLCNDLRRLTSLRGTEEIPLEAKVGTF